MKCHTAEFLRININGFIPQEELISYPTIKTRVENCIEGLKIEIIAFIAAMPSQRIEIDEKWPINWWQAFREQWFPGWWLIRHPIRYRRIHINQQLYSHICPHLQENPKSTHLKFLASSRSPGGIINGISPKAPQDRRSAELRIRLTPDEREQLDAVAGSGTSTWARQILLKVARREIAKSNDAKHRSKE